MIKTLTLLVSVLSFTTVYAAADATVPAPVEDTTDATVPAPVEDTTDVAPADADVSGN